MSGQNIPDNFAASQITTGYDIRTIAGENKDTSLKANKSSIKGTGLPSSSNFLKPISDSFTSSDGKNLKLPSSGELGQAMYASAVNFVERFADGNIFELADTGQSQSFLTDIAAKNDMLQAIKGMDLVPENEGNFGPGSVSFG